MKDLVQKIQDSSLIQIFLDFTQTFHLQYQKISKQISYKCHQATWILAVTKATGYGRTQMQAYRHSLRNLFQLLIEEPQYTNYFIKTFQDLGILSRKLTIKQQIKTEMGEDRIHRPGKIVESYTKTSLIFKKHQNPSYCSKQDKKEIYHSKIMLNKNNRENNQNSKKEQLKNAKARLKQLQQHLQKLVAQNNLLKEKINDQTREGSGSTLPSKIDSDQCHKFKVNIPKLKLQILPNYHKNSQKSLNQNLLAAYHEKQQGILKKLQ